MSKEFEHLAYKIVDDLFMGFVKNNRSFLEKMKEGEIRKIVKKMQGICAFDVFEYPWNVTHVGKIDGGEGWLYMFFNDDLDKIYTVYDVD